MQVYDADNYREFVTFILKEQAWGAVKRVAEALKCHSTYVSQVSKGKADFSTEQALAFCRYAELDLDATEHFLDLLNHEKAGDQETRAFFDQKIKRRLEGRLNIKRRLKITDNLNADQERLYYSGWLPQLVHLACQLPGEQSAASIARRIKAEVDTVESILLDLQRVGLIEYSKNAIKVLKESVHLGEESANIQRFHVNWRMKTAADLSAFSRLPGFHYSSVVSMSPETGQEIRKLILQHVEASRALIIPSPPEGLYAYCLDFYPLTLAADKEG